MSVCPCGATMGHGESCVAGYLCEPCTEIKRLRAELATRGDAAFREWSFQNAKITEVAAFLDRMADRLPLDEEDNAADCRAMAARLRDNRGEST